VLGTLYPAYRSYKALKNKDLREHVKWMMYWIVFALFTTLETFLDIFLSWFPFYYEIKILFILWVLSPATRGSSLLYKKIVHPMLVSREKDIDELIEKAKQQGYSTFLQLFSSGFNYASSLFLSSAMRGHLLLGDQLKKSFSMNDVYAGANAAVTSGNNGAGHRPLVAESHVNCSDDVIREDDEYGDFDQRYHREASIVAARTVESRSAAKKIPAKKQIYGSNPSLNIIHNKPSYDLIDDDDDDDNEESVHVDNHAEMRRFISANATAPTATTVTNGSAATRRRGVATKQSTTAGYRSNEASHFGTITRAKTSKSRNIIAPTSLINHEKYDN